MSASASEGDISSHGFKTAALCQEETLAGWSLYFRLGPSRRGRRGGSAASSHRVQEATLPADPRSDLSESYPSYPRNGRVRLLARAQARWYRSVIGAYITIRRMYDQCRPTPISTNTWNVSCGPTMPGRMVGTPANSSTAPAV